MQEREMFEGFESAFKWTERNIYATLTAIFTENNETAECWNSMKLQWKGKLNAFDKLFNLRSVSVFRLQYGKDKYIFQYAVVLTIFIERGEIDTF